MKPRDLALALLALPLIHPAAAQQAPTFFVMANVDPFYAVERGGSSVPARGAAVAVRPVAGMTGVIPGDINLTVLGGASATRYAVTPTSDSDSLFGMASLSKTVEGTKFGASFLFANARNPTFATGVAKIYDTSLSVSHTFTPEALGGWTLTPQLKATRRLADTVLVEQWNLGASVEFSRAVASGTFTFGGGYDWLDYIAEGRHDDKFSVSSSWLIDLNDNVQVGVKADASFLKSNLDGKSVDSFTIGPALRVMFTK